MIAVTLPKMKTTIQALAEAGLSEKVSVLVGGALVTAVYAGQIGADAFADDAVGALDSTLQLVSVK